MFTVVSILPKTEEELKKEAARKAPAPEVYAGGPSNIINIIAGEQNISSLEPTGIIERTNEGEESGEDESETDSQEENALVELDEDAA